MLNLNEWLFEGINNGSGLEFLGGALDTKAVSQQKPFIRFFRSLVRTLVQSIAVLTALVAVRVEDSDTILSGF